MPRAQRGGGYSPSAAFVGLPGMELPGDNVVRGHGKSIARQQVDFHYPGEGYQSVITPGDPMVRRMGYYGKQGGPSFGGF